jgi:hypothetical protein
VVLVLQFLYVRKCTPVPLYKCIQSVSRESIGSQVGLVVRDEVDL